LSLLGYELVYPGGPSVGQDLRDLPLGGIG